MKSILYYFIATDFTRKCSLVQFDGECKFYLFNSLFYFSFLTNEPFRKALSHLITALFLRINFSTRLTVVL